MPQASQGGEGSLESWARRDKASWGRAWAAVPGACQPRSGGGGAAPVLRGEKVPDLSLEGTLYPGPWGSLSEMARGC